MPLLIVFLGILSLLLLIIYFRLNAFIALVVVALAVGMAQGMPATDALASIEKGIGSTLGGLTLILGFGAMLGGIVAESGAAQQITASLTRRFSGNRLPWALTLTGFIIGIPMFYTVGFVMMVPIIFTITAATRMPLLYIAIPMVSALSVTHGFLPPHPGPTAIATIFKADVAKTLLLGLTVAIPTVIVAGPLFSRLLRNYRTTLPKGLFDHEPLPESKLPPLGISIISALMPVILMALGAVTALWDNHQDYMVLRALGFIGKPGAALLISVLLAIYTLGFRGGRNMKDVGEVLQRAIKGVAMILLIISGGGAFKQVLIDSGVGDYIAQMMDGVSFSPLILAWCIAAALRIALGSATVAALTAAGIVAPLVSQSGTVPELMVLAIGAGSLMLSNVNDAGFWMFKEYFNLSIKQTFSTWSVMETIVSVGGLLGCLLLSSLM